MPVPTARPRPAPTLLLLGLLLLAATLAGLALGSVGLDPGQLARALWPGQEPVADGLAQQLVWDLRAPRVLLAGLIGAALAGAGTAMQGLFRNPLADPGLVGVSSGSALAAVAVMVAGHALHLPSALQPWLVPLAAFAGGVTAAWLAARLASGTGGSPATATLLLAGLAINAIAGAGIGLLTQWAEHAALRDALFWLFGSLARGGWTELAVCAPPLLAVMIWLARQGRALNALLLGEAEAQHLGVDVRRFKRRLLAAVVLAVALSVALAGIIGFVGLLVPHLLRLLLGPDHRGLLPASLLGGATLLILADLVARTAMSPAELPVGILTALVGGPFFLGLLLRLRGRVEPW